MFDLMGAIRQRQKTQTPPPADSAETAESPQPRAGKPAESLRETADTSAGAIFSATIRKNPQRPQTRNPPETKGRQGFSANPQNPQTPTGKVMQNPDAVLLEVAQTLSADIHMLRALLSDDDMQAIATGDYSRQLLTQYFRQMRQDGKQLVDPQWHLDNLLQQAANRSRLDARQHAEWEEAWRAAHDSFIDHLMRCSDCLAPQHRYCGTGQALRRDYLYTYQNKGAPAHD